MKNKLHCIYLEKDSVYNIDHNRVYKLFNGKNEFMDSSGCIDTYDGRLNINPNVSYSYNKQDFKLFVPESNQEYVIKGSMLFGYYKKTTLLDDAVEISFFHNPYTYGSNFVALYETKFVNKSNWLFLYGFTINAIFPKTLKEDLSNKMIEYERINGVQPDFKVKGELHYIKSNDKPKSVGEFIYEGFAVKVKSFEINK